MRSCDAYNLLYIVQIDEYKKFKLWTQQVFLVELFGIEKHADICHCFYGLISLVCKLLSTTIT